MPDLTKTLGAALEPLPRGQYDANQPVPHARFVPEHESGYPFEIYQTYLTLGYSPEEAQALVLEAIDIVNTKNPNNKYLTGEGS